MIDGTYRLWTTAETAYFLGYDIETITGWREIGEGPRWMILIGSDVRYDPNDVLEWVEERKCPPAGAPDQPAAGCVFPDATVRELVVGALGEEWAKSYLDRSDWDPKRRVIKPWTNYAASKFRDAVDLLAKLSEIGVTVGDAGANDAGN
jgi:hypothetical protein